MAHHRVISIGALDAHPLWDERAAVRTGHSTTTLIVAGDMRLLVDPGLPAEALAARLSERANLAPADITHVFLTSFRPDARRALALFDGAVWWISEAEREAVGVPMIATLQEADEANDDDTKAVIAREVALLQKTTPAPDKLAQGVDLFPLPGVTPGLAGLRRRLDVFDDLVDRRLAEQFGTQAAARVLERARRALGHHLVQHHVSPALEGGGRLVLARQHQAAQQHECGDDKRGEDEAAAVSAHDRPQFQHAVRLIGLAAHGYCARPSLTTAEN